MTRNTTLHGTFKCVCGNRVCTVGTGNIRCTRCGRRYGFREYPDMLEKSYNVMLMEAGKWT